ncbi:MAG: hypothetical protein WAV75_00815, partial [Streptococcus suis]
RDWGTVSGMIGCDIKNPPVCFLYQYTGGRSDWIDTLLWGAYKEPKKEDLVAFFWGRLVTIMLGRGGEILFTVY